MMAVISSMRLVVLCLLALSLFACAPPMAVQRPEVPISPTAGRELPESIPQEKEPESRPESVPPAEEAKKPSKKDAGTAPSRSSPVVSLMQDADASSASGNLDNAAATLERAIRLQPRNALLWHKLAEVRLQQQQPGLAEDLAKKSNVLAKSDRALMSKNWTIIAEARRRKGDAEGANEAEARANR